MTEKTTKKTTNRSKKTTQKHPKKSITITAKKNKRITRKINKKITLVIIILLGVLLIFSSYAWFSMNLNVKIKTFRMIITKNSDLRISFDAVNYDYFLDITKENILDNLKETYPSHTNQYAKNGFIPVSSAGIPNPDTPKFNLYQTSGVMYSRRDRERKNGFITTVKSNENIPREHNYYLAFDLFIKNDTGSPEPDNMYLAETTFLNAVEENLDDEMLGLINSFRIGIVKIGSASLDTPVSELQALTCNGNCSQIIYEPNSKNHAPLAIERAGNKGIEIVDGLTYPTYAYHAAGGPIYIKDSLPGSNLDPQFFTLQKTIYESDFKTPVFELPNGITKIRVYVWIEGQDIDSLETNSTGAEVEIGIDLTKDTAGYAAYDE